jgi:hypothetical protein
VAIISLQELQSFNLPVDLSGYQPSELNALILQASSWVNGECRHYKGFESHRVVDRVYGRGTNVLFTTYFPILALNTVKLIFPPNAGNVNLPGPNQVPIDPSRVIIDHQAGVLKNWSPFVFQTIGYMTVFPDDVPIDIDYYTGYVNSVTSTVVQAGSVLVPVNNASTFFYGQTIRFYEAGVDEQVLCVGATVQGGSQFVMIDSPTQYVHQQGVSFGDMPPEVKLACAYVVCDMAITQLNPENLAGIKIDKISKTYQRELTVRSKMDLVGGPQIETERQFIKEARRLLEHYYTDRGIN